uniref:Protein RIC1 homolog n=1 Tax=Timema tahoe TaxID=61484 RepID=A0A7R9IIR6_9NEOP|nr:unnamed protein product [Timema tahoe]
MTHCQFGFVRATLASCIGKDVEKCKHVQIFSKASMHPSHSLKSKDIINVIEMSMPCVPIVLHRRSYESIEDIGVNELVEWRPDSSMLVVATSGGHLLLYNLGVQTDQKGLYEQVDSPHANLRRDSAELFIKEVIPSLHLSLEKEVGVEGGITSMVCIRDELMLATTRGHILRYRWDGSENRDYCLDLRRVPFCIDQQVSKAIPIVEANTYVVDIEYSPLVGGFAIVLNDGRAAFLTASSLRFDPNQVQGIWAQNIEDATCASVNHKYRLIAFGRKNSQGVVYCIDESTGGLEVSHHIVLSSKDYPGSPGLVLGIRWTPDGCAMAIAWANGGLSLWSTFGALLMCTLGWDYGLHVDLNNFNPLHVYSMEWSAEGYQLWMVRRQPDHDPGGESGSTIDTVVQLDFVKSALTVNPCMSHLGHLYLQGEDRLFVNLGDNLMKVYHERPRDQLSTRFNSEDVFRDISNLSVTNTLVGSKQWIVVPIPSAYSGTNWPIRYTAIDSDGQNIAVAGRTGLAHYSLLTRKWKLFGNETQEKDFVVTGGLLWWRDYVVMGCYSIVENKDEIRIYPRDSRLDNAFMKVTRVPTQVLLLNMLRDRLITFCANGQVSVYSLSLQENHSQLEVTELQSVDISALCVHPACVVSVMLTALRTETGRHASKEVESIMLNVSGKLLMVQREQHRPINHHEENYDDEYQSYTCSPPTVLASCVENVWVPRKSRREKPHLTEALWLFCGAHGMRVWLPLFPRDGDKSHSFMSKRIMLPFQLRIYPLAILFEDAILLGAENDTMLYTSDSNSPFSLPFCVLERTSQVYLHQILRQLIRRNLGYHAWEIARSCTNLPYFPHSLELLLHELPDPAPITEKAPNSGDQAAVTMPGLTKPIAPSTSNSAPDDNNDLDQAHTPPMMMENVVITMLRPDFLPVKVTSWVIVQYLLKKSKKHFVGQVLEEEATSKEPIPDALLPSVIEFIKEFPVYQQTVVQCARKTEIALWPYLFSAAGKPKDLFQECLAKKHLDTAASYLIILQNLEPSSISRQYATLLLDAALEQCKWDLSKDLVRFLRAIDPNDVESPRASFILPSKYGVSAQTPPVSPNEEDLSLVLGTMQVSRGRSFSTTTTPKVQQIEAGPNSVPAHHREVLRSNSGAGESSKSVPLRPHRLTDLGHFAAYLDFHLVSWLGRERDRVARVDDFVGVLKQLHSDFQWPYPTLQLPVSYYLPRKSSASGSSQVSPSSPTIEERMKSLTVDVIGGHLGSRVGDSGYTSYPGGHHDAFLMMPNSNLPVGLAGPMNYPHSMLLPSEYPSSAIVEAQLLPHLLQDESSVVSEESSFWGEEREHYVSDSSDARWNDIPSSFALDQLTQELSSRGSAKAEVKLRYLLQLFMEASCLEWSLIISVLLRDAMAVLRTVNAARSPDQSSEAVQRLKEGFQLLFQWSSTECLGYKPFMMGLHPQVNVLNKLLTIKRQQQALVRSTVPPPSPPKSRSRHSSTTQDGGSVGQPVSDCAPSSQSSRGVEEESTLMVTRERSADRGCELDIRNQLVMEAAKEKAIESSGCVVS